MSELDSGERIRKQREWHGRWAGEAQSGMASGGEVGRVREKP